jgi:hypothetical protein
MQSGVLEQKLTADDMIAHVAQHRNGGKRLSPSRLFLDGGAGPLIEQRRLWTRDDTLQVGILTRR